VLIVLIQFLLLSCDSASYFSSYSKKGSPCSITERKVPELILVLGSQPAGDVSHNPEGRLPLLSARPAVTHTTLKNQQFCCLVNRGTMGVNSLPPKTVTGQRHGCDLGPGPFVPESSVLTTRLPSHPSYSTYFYSGKPEEVIDLKILWQNCNILLCFLYQVQ